MAERSLGPSGERRADRQASVWWIFHNLTRLRRTLRVYPLYDRRVPYGSGGWNTVRTQGYAAPQRCMPGVEGEGEHRLQSLRNTT